MSQWWVGRRGADPVGPVSTETLVRGVKEKKVPPNALVCRVGEQQWMHVSQVDELWDKISPEEAPTAITEKPWFKQADSSPPGQKSAQADSGPPAAEKLADADEDDDDATRIYRANSVAQNRAPEDMAVRHEAPPNSAAEQPAESPAVAATKATASPAVADAPVHAARALSKIAPAKASAPSFRAPASLTQKVQAQESGPQPAPAPAGNKEAAKTPKAVIPAPRFGVDRIAPASPIAATEFISKPPSVRPEAMAAETTAAQTQNSHRVRQTAETAPSNPVQTARRTADPVRMSTVRRTSESGQQSAVPSGQPSVNHQIAPRPGQSSPPPAQTSEPRKTTEDASQQPQQAVTRPGQSSPPPAQQTTTRPRQNSAPAVQHQVPRPASNPPNQAATRPAQSAIPAARQTGAGQSRQPSVSNSAKSKVAEKARQTMPSVPSALSALPPNSEMAAMVRDNVDVSLVETRPERRMPLGSRPGASQPPPAMAPDEASKAGANEAKPEARKETAHSAAAAKPATEHAPIVARPIVNIAEPDDDATVVRKAPVASAPLRDDVDDDITIARMVPSVPPQPATDDDDATVIKRVNPIPAVAPLEEPSAKAASTEPGLSELERLATRSADANRSGERPIAPPPANEAPVPPPPPPSAPGNVAAPATQAPVALRSSPDGSPGELYDADDDALPARAKDYAGAHGPPSVPTNAKPRPAAGTPLPPSVIVAPHAQPQVPIDALGRVVQPYSDLTHPAMRTIRPPGTVQVSIATLIVGAMAIVVIVLAAVLVLR